MKIINLFATCLLISFAAKSQPKIPADSAASHIGEIVTVCAKVYGVKSFDKVTLINVGAAYPKSPLTIAIFAKDKDKFDMENLKDKSICITGKIEDFKGKAEIILSNPANLKFVAPEAVIEVPQERQ